MDCDLLSDFRHRGNSAWKYLRRIADRERCRAGDHQRSMAHTAAGGRCRRCRGLGPGTAGVVSRFRPAGEWHTRCPLTIRSRWERANRYTERTAPRRHQSGECLLCRDRRVPNRRNATSRHSRCRYRSGSQPVGHDSGQPDRHERDLRDLQRIRPGHTHRREHHDTIAA